MAAPSYSPIFVVGTPRSGTTLTARILGRHSHIFMPGETQFFPDIYAKRNTNAGVSESEACGNIFEQLSTLYQKYNEPADQERIERLLSDPETVRRLKTSLGDYRSAFTFFMEIQMQSEGKIRWGNNTPKDLFFVEDIIRFYPEAKFIICVRDVRDFLCSYKGKWRITAEEQVERLKKLYHPVVTSMLWKSSMRQIPIIERVVPKNNRVILPYEKLVADPQEAIRNICGMIGEEYEPGMLDVTFSNSSGPSSAKGVYSTSTGKWRHELAPEETWIAQRVASREMQQLGYPLEKVTFSPLRAMACIGMTPVALWRALQANKRNSGPILPYLMRRTSALFYRS